MKSAKREAVRRLAERHRRWATSALGVLAVVVFASACGGGSKGDAAPSEPASPTRTAPSEPVAQPKDMGRVTEACGYTQRALASLKDTSVVIVDKSGAGCPDAGVRLRRARWHQGVGRSRATGT